VQADGAELTTIEGEAAELEPLRDAFKELLSFQCGFCTPGFMMTAVELLRENPRPSDDEIREAISGNLCRCTGYESIVRGIALAAERAQ
jgi:carbon-monoxide dehydrogenase small subunit